ncbi:MAG: hypothetical protein AAGB51_06850 [Planctomycetota bacterium]
MLILLLITDSSALGRGLNDSPDEQASSASAVLSDNEIAVLYETYRSLSDAEQQAMVAVYEDLGIDLGTLMEAKENKERTAATPGAPPSIQLMEIIRTIGFVRQPETVLAARARIGIKPEPLPGADAGAQELIDWMSRHVMAGEWDAFAVFLAERAGPEAEQIYSHVLQSTNDDKSELLPEDVLGLSEAAPAELTDWQVSALAALLKRAAANSSLEPLLARIEDGTRWFGSQDEAARERTARLLVAAGLAERVIDYLPPLAKAREEGNAVEITAHAEYRAALARAGTDSDVNYREAWQLFGEVGLMEDAEFEMRLAAIGRAVGLLPRVPPKAGTAWLTDVLQSERVAAATLQSIALESLRVGEALVSEDEAAQAILTMKEAVDTLLEAEGVDRNAMRVPLRMLTIGLLSRAEQAIDEHLKTREVQPVSSQLLRALPDREWRDGVEASLSGRMYDACLGVALLCDEVDIALDLLSEGVESNPEAARALAESFLSRWVIRLRAADAPQQEFYGYFYFGSRRPSPTLTRGRQNRNLDRLGRLLDVMEEAGVEARSLDGVVPAFAACHSRAETYQRETVERVLGPIDGIAPAVAASMAGAMRSGLNGDWRNREAQQDEGFQRSESELRAIVERGYELAIDLIDSAIDRSETDKWEFALTKASLVYDRMRFRRQKEQDTADYHTARREVFRSLAAASSQYRAAVQSGDLRPDIGLYITWFSLSLGSSDLGALTADDLLTEGVVNADQIDLIHAGLREFEPELTERHIGAFAREIVAALPQVQAEAKPRLVEAAVRIAGDHPAGAPLRRTLALYHDLLNDEIELRMSLDGDERVGTEPFGVSLTLRYTAEIDRSTGGFAQYLQTSSYGLYNGVWQFINHRERLEKSIRESFGDSIEMISIGYFEPMNPATPVTQRGERGWEEKPFAYIVLRATDESIDAVPQIQVDLSFEDTTGSVVLPVVSNILLIDAGSEPIARPTSDVLLEQMIDPRPLLQGEEGREVHLDVTIAGAGVMPTLEQLFPALDKVLPGYRVIEEKVQEEPMEVSAAHLRALEEYQEVSGESFDRSNAYRWDEEDKTDYVEPDEGGLFRLGSSRSWSITLAPESSGVVSPEGFAFPEPNGIGDAFVVRRSFDDVEVIDVSGNWVAFERNGVHWLWWVGPLLLVCSAAAVLFAFRALRATGGIETKPGVAAPERDSPLSALMTLRRIEAGFGDRFNDAEARELRADIDAIQHAHFADGESQAPARFDSMLQRWVQKTRGPLPPTDS